jgi:hypothetical protein
MCPESATTQDTSPSSAGNIPAHNGPAEGETTLFSAFAYFLLSFSTLLLLSLMMVGVASTGATALWMMTTFW